ncbi:hypothetical protein DAPPUDRAFT_113096 [Daphnia pulex]|uniref:DDE Tnp4 domain-containing protein n=1 Tax=Daphnia pulex TaxID=6669 RepID=E9HE20_DAPPU|nr:hypothetical protein DAPPUDRAFT_113096 [Daphnia pulex]|eukprot:EFX70022.1 hypothetical protein DAPPUDRAFT_113096 [Daphnia pulex]
MASAENFWRLGHNIAKHDVDGSIALGYRKFRSFFGTSLSVCAAAYDNLSHVRPIKSRPEHLLWTLLHLKHYATEHISSALVGESEKNISEVIEWENRFHRALRGSNILVSIDGVDFRIMEPSPFNPKWYSHKFHGPGLRYELAICIQTGDIVWAYGGLPCGE